jgi:hypothetical protein
MEQLQLAPQEIASEPLSHRERIALRKIGNVPNFHWFAWEMIGDDATLMTGCVVTRTYSKGPRKGCPVYDGERVKVVVSDSEIATERARYEQETGNCGECLGQGKVIAGWHHERGISYRECHLCHSGGKING